MEKMEKRRAIVLLIFVIAFIVMLMFLRLYRQKEHLQYNVDRITGNCISRIARNLSEYHMSELDDNIYNYISDQNRTWYAQACELYPYSSFAGDTQIRAILSCMGTVIGDSNQDIDDGRYIYAYHYEDIYNDQELRDALAEYGPYKTGYRIELKEIQQTVFEKLEEIVQLLPPEMRDSDAA